MKTALVTGASSGIGAAVVSMLLELNYKVYGIGRSFTKETKDINFIPLVCDLTDTKTLIQKITPIKNSEQISLLINCAGVGYYGLHEELNPSKIHEMVTVNTEVPMLLTNLFLRDLKKLEGTIINVSSVTAHKSSPHGCTYGATKAALSSFSESLFDEVRKYNVKVITIHPDMTQTNLYRNADFNVGPTLDTYLVPEEVADAIRYLLTRRDGMVITDITLKPQKHQLSKQSIASKSKAL